MSKLVANIRRIRVHVALILVGCLSLTANAQLITQPQPGGNQPLQDAQPQQEDQTQQEAQPRPRRWMTDDTMTGDWGGERTQLAADGLKFLGVYTGQLGDDLSGGKRQGSAYAQQFSIAMDADLDKLFGWSGAVFRININDRIGRGFSAQYTGSKLEQDWAYGAGAIKRLQWMALSQDLFDKKLNLLVGYYSMGSEFGYSPIQAAFLDNGINGHPQILPTDGSGGWDDYPIAGWGGRAKIYLKPDLTLKTGIYEVNPDLNSGQYGFKFSFDDATAAIIPTELTQTLHLKSSPGAPDLVGHYTLGGYYETGRAPDILDPEVKDGDRHAVYLMADQMVYRSAENPQRWVSVFTQLVTADHRTLPLSSYLDAGVIIQGPFGARPNDSINIGWVKENVNPRMIDVEAEKMHGLPDMYQYAEHDYEANYVIQLSPWLQLTPALQYVVDPGAYSYKHYPNAFVFSMQLGILL